MQFKNLAFSLFAAAVAADDVNSLVAQIPSCALTCLVTSATQVNCGITDYKCQCENATELQAVATPCVSSACSVADQATALKISGEICVSLGYTAVTSAVNSAVTSATGAAGSALSSATSAIGSAASSATATGTSSSATSSASTAAAAGRVEMGALAGVAAVVAFAL